MTLYVQAAYDMSNSTCERENPLNIKENDKKIVVSGRYDDIEQVDGIPNINSADWGLEES